MMGQEIYTQFDKDQRMQVALLDLPHSHFRIFIEAEQYVFLEELNFIYVCLFSTGLLKPFTQHRFSEILSPNSKTRANFLIPLDKSNEILPYQITFFSESGLVELSKYKFKITPSSVLLD